MDLENLTTEALIELYFKLKNEKEDYESDAEYSLQTLDDPKVDYMLKTELRNDIRYDKEQIEKISEQLKIIEVYAEKNNIILERSNKLGV